MDIKSIIQKAFLEGYATNDISIYIMFICVLFSAAIAVYICVVYRLQNKNSFFDRSFQLSLFGLAIITAMIILTIQANIVVSLGMVGALSIVRFRTAIKNPMDLVFLFWSISAGIICGAGYAMIAVIGSLVVTLGIVAFSMLKAESETLILVVNLEEYDEDSLEPVLDEECSNWKVRARNVSKIGTNMAIEVKTKSAKNLVTKISGIEKVASVSLVEHDGDVTM